MRGDRSGPLNSSIEARIDAALRSYVEPPCPSDPRTAVAAILDRARPIRTRRPLWIWAIPAAACLALAFGLLLWLHAQPAPRIARAVPPPPPVVAVPDAGKSAMAKVPVRIVHRANSRTAPLPKLDVFPAPTRLSPQERELVAFVRHAPPAVTQAVIDDQQRWDQPADTTGLNVGPPKISAESKTQEEEPQKENR